MTFLFFHVHKLLFKSWQIVAGLSLMNTVTLVLSTDVVYITLVPRTASGQSFQGRIKQSKLSFQSFFKKENISTLLKCFNQVQNRGLSFGSLNWAAISQNNMAAVTIVRRLLHAPGMHGTYNYSCCFSYCIVRNQKSNNNKEISSYI